MLTFQALRFRSWYSFMFAFHTYCCPINAWCELLSFDLIFLLLETVCKGWLASSSKLIIYVIFVYQLYFHNRYSPIICCCCTIRISILLLKLHQFKYISISVVITFTSKQVFFGSFIFDCTFQNGQQQSTLLLQNILQSYLEGSGNLCWNFKSTRKKCVVGKYLRDNTNIQKFNDAYSLFNLPLIHT